VTLHVVETEVKSRSDFIRLAQKRQLDLSI